MTDHGPFLGHVPHERPRSVPVGVLALAAMLTLWSCGDSDDGPAGPDANEVTQVQISPGDLSLLVGNESRLTATALNASGGSVSTTVSWSSDTESVATVDQTGLVTAVAEGSATVTATADGESASVEVTVEELSEFMMDYIEAIFLGSGPLTPQDGFTACVTNPGRWTAFPRGTTVEVVASTTLDMGNDGEDTAQLLEDALASIEEATLGAVTATFSTTTDADPTPGMFQATATDHPDPESTGCPFDRGCVHVTWSDAEFTVMESSRTVLKEDIQPADAFVHDVVGHGIMGMCHIDQELVGGNDQTLMPGGPGSSTGVIPDQLSALDIQAARAVYGTDLEPGATRADFVARGLIRP